MTRAEVVAELADRARAWYPQMTPEEVAEYAERQADIALGGAPDPGEVVAKVARHM